MDTPRKGTGTESLPAALQLTAIELHRGEGRSGEIVDVLLKHLRAANGNRDQVNGILSDVVGLGDQFVQSGTYRLALLRAFSNPLVESLTERTEGAAMEAIQ